MKKSGNTLTRRSVLSAGAAGISWLAACSSHGRVTPKNSFDGDVVIVGAGPAGMTAAHLLQQKGVSVTVHEAAAAAGGRVKHNVSFTDFPIPLGAEWVHTDESILQEILNDPTVSVTTELIAYGNDAQIWEFDGDELTLQTHTESDTDLKFVGSSWLDYFSTYLLPGIAEKILYNSQVIKIDYRGERLALSSAAGKTFTADRVIVTAPISTLQRGDIDFYPPLPPAKAKAISKADVWGGLKVFLEFKDKFYPAFLEFPDSETQDGQRLYYDAAYGQNSSANVLGLFAVGQQAVRYQNASPDALRDMILRELDKIFDNQASRGYLRHIVQDWNTEPFAGAAYLADVSDPAISRRLSTPVDGRVFFAGEAYTSFDDWGGVHAATRSAAEAVNRIIT